MSKAHTFLTVLLLPTFYFLFTDITHAAEMFFEQETRSVREDQFEMRVVLRTTESLNAIEGKIHFPDDLLELVHVEDGNSIINFWLERPTRGMPGEIAFSGITPGGYVGRKGPVFSMIFLVKGEGAGAFAIRDAVALLNDGEGSAAKVQTFDSPFIISKKTVDIRIPVSEVADVEPPESFKPEIARDPSLFEGKEFVVFAAQDKESGVDRYEVKESRQRFLHFFSPWMSAESPRVLADQELRSHVFVRAVDRNGNARTERIPPKHPLPWHKNYENGVILLIAATGVYAVAYLWKAYRIRR